MTAPTLTPVDPIPVVAPATPASPPPVPVVAEPPPPPDPPKPTFEEITIPTESVIGIRLDRAISSETARVEDRVNAKVTRDVTVDGRTAIPANARLEGVVSAIERGGKFKSQARLGVRFNMLILPNGSRVPIQTETIFRDGEPPAGSSTAKVGSSAVLGTILGAMIGGGKGAAVGAVAGVGGGAAAVAAGDRSEAVLPAGTNLTVRLTAPATVTIEKGESVKE